MEKMKKKDQNRAPIYEALQKFRHMRVVPFDVPGHKHGRGNPELTAFLGEQCVGIDVNSMKPLDNLCHPVSVIREAEDLTAEAFGAAHAFLMVGGTTSSVQSMVLSACKRGDKIIMPRNVHRSVINALVLCGAVPVYVNPEVDRRLGISLGMQREQVAKAIAENPDAVAVLVNNPTYYGICSDLKAIVKMAHEAGMYCLVDEAHGTHFYFGENMPISAMEAGADMAAVSMHKSGGSLTQSSLLLTGPRVNAGHVRQIINLTQTTSGSYLLMSSLDISRRNLALRGREVFAKVVSMADYAREEINAIGGYYAFGRELINGNSVFDFDPTKLSVHTRRTKMSRVLVIGCGGVASVAIRKCCQVSEVFTELCIASRTKAKCDELAAKLQGKTSTIITTAQVDADDVQQIINLINSYKPDLVMNIALPYQDLTIMDACLACGVNYMDTANYEPEDTDDPKWREIYEKRCKEQGFSAYFDYSWQWAYREKFEQAGLTALLGCGFDPGVTQAYCAFAKKHEFDTIDTIDILDCNGGDHGYPFATNFNPEVNLREVSAPGSYWEDGHWVEIPAMSIKREYDFDCVGQKDMYLLHHEEIESLAQNIPEVKRIRFFMTFVQSYLTHMKCLENVGMLSTTPIHFEGQEIVPIKFLKALLPDPASLGPRTHGKTNIGCIFTGKKDGQEKSYYIYNVCDHQECYREVESQAISYTTGVPAMCGALMLLTGKWNMTGVHTVEEFDPDPFLDALDKYGLPRSESHSPVLVD